ncbi:Uncharacterized protein OS=Singulisphaera acidiphila (strain ATCC BAA-1392 / DSM 18658 / VKM B-2454 / MOB10) GN=Sinac_7637 PE=4 SV=1 [Gemmata massiliana]|uniref:Uncharacterized protein n=1 Tax=Gemmata massiliana TaxID=1210884 RepID=A0A6P2CYH2_9BACT|nr:hypothetical protein [Gemmata massiliana]VTR92844.1 Uncharacterized protein OS=Singulisphaera acidiphila (strain ATCC BAA-1392 / DSM 18658 / VKM B-2454 / MOB10) GN=Sinac_7637 PE=4 SV=1 [Gemmata massiliana]
MGWDKNGRYYTRSRRVNGRVVREYIGGGRAGELVAQMDAIARDKRETERACAKIARERVEALDAPLAELNEQADLLIQAALVAAGLRQHKRGEWRKKRGEHESGTSTG